MYCPSAPFASVCMSETEYKYVMQKAVIENRYLKDKLNLRIVKKFDHLDLSISFLLGAAVFYVIDKDL